MLAIQFLGAATTVTGSRYCVTYGDSKFLIDCGLFQGEDEARNFSSLWQNPVPYKALLLTHAHIDHSGLIPRLVAEGFSGPILCTPPTQDLCTLMLPDSAKIQMEDADDLAPLYTREDAEEALKLLQNCPYGEPRQVVPGVKVTFFDAGHILGSAWLELSFQPLPDWEQQKPLTVVFSGDVGRGNKILLEPPEQPEQADFLVLESTYGDRLHPRTSIGDELAKIINEIADDGSTLVIPAFAVQRSQEVAKLVENLWNQRRIDSLDLFLDSPMAVRATAIFEHYPDYLKASLEEGLRLHGRLLRYPYLRMCLSTFDSRAVSGFRGPKIIISASGMAEGGRVLHHLRRYLPDPHSQILLAGFQCEGTRGWKLQQGAAAVEIHGRQVPVRARVRTLQGLSGHADYLELQDWLSCLEAPPRRTLLVHGEPSALEAHRQRLQAQGWEAQVPAFGEIVRLA